MLGSDLEDWHKWISDVLSECDQLTHLSLSFAGVKQDSLWANNPGPLALFFTHICVAHQKENQLSSEVGIATAIRPSYFPKLRNSVDVDGLQHTGGCLHL